MKCPYCQNECEEGIAESTDLNFMSKWKINVLWYPSQEEGKLLKKDLHSMPRKTKAYYCHQSARYLRNMMFIRMEKQKAHKIHGE